MKRTVLGVGPLLAGMVAKGLVTVEQLDVPTPRWQAELPLMTEYRVMGGRPVPEWRNPAREWIEAHPGDWVALQKLHAEARQNREQFRRSRSGLGWPAAAEERLAEVPATPARGWADSDDLVDFEP
jgi:hypothetical protein